MINKNFEPFPVLETERLILTEISIKYLDDLSLILSDPEVAKYEYFYPTENSEQVEKFILRYQKERNEKEEITWGIIAKTSKKLIGTCCLGDFSESARRAEVGYAMARNEWGKGYATEAIKAIVEYGFAEMNLNRIEAFITPGNVASIRVLEKIGFIKEGHVRERDLIKGELVDGIIMSKLLKEHLFRSDL